MKKHFLIGLFLIVGGLSSCLDADPMYQQITVLKTPLQRIDDLNKSDIEIKKAEEKAALAVQESDYLEYEYPIKEDESYVVSYRFDADGCFEIGLDTYFNKEEEAKNVVDGIIDNLTPIYGEPEKEGDLYLWGNEKADVELDVQNIERGMISLTIFAIE